MISTVRPVIPLSEARLMKTFIPSSVSVWRESISTISVPSGLVLQKMFGPSAVPLSWVTLMVIVV